MTAPTSTFPAALDDPFALPTNPRNTKLGDPNFYHPTWAAYIESRFDAMQTALGIATDDSDAATLYGQVNAALAQQSNANVASYTPALTAATTNPTLGTGAVDFGIYNVDVGGMVRIQFKIVFGTGMSAGAGTIYMSLPVAAPALLYQNSMKLGGNVIISDANGNFTECTAALDSTKGGNVVKFLPNGSAAPASASVPITFVAGDSIEGTIWYLIGDIGSGGTPGGPPPPPPSSDIATYSGDFGASATGKTFSYTLPSGLNRALLVAVTVEVPSGDTDRTVTGVTYNGIAMTLATDAQSPTPASATVNETSNIIHTYIYELREASLPAVGAHSVVVTLSGALGTNSWAAAAAHTVANVVQNGPDKVVVATSTTDGTTVSDNITTLNASSFIIDLVAGSAEQAWTDDSSQTQLLSQVNAHSGNGFAMGISSKSAASIGSYTMSWSAAGTQQRETHILMAYGPPGSTIPVAALPDPVITTITPANSLSATSQSVDFTGHNTAGTLLVMVLGHSGFGRTTTGPSGFTLANGTTGTSVADNTDGHREIWYKIAAGSETTVAWSVSGAATAMFTEAYQVANADTFLDSNHGGQHFGAIAFETGNTALTSSKKGVAFAGVITSSTVTGTWTNGFTELNANVRGHTAAKILSSVGAIGTELDATASDGIGCIAVFTGNAASGGGGTPPPPPPPPPPPVGNGVKAGFGIYPGFNNGGNFQNWEHGPLGIWSNGLGRQMNYVLQMTDATSPTAMGGNTYASIASMASRLNAVFSIPAAFFNGAGSCAQVAAHNFDAQYNSIIGRLNGYGFKSLTLRIGWEYDGNWMPWSPINQGTTNFANAFRNIVTLAHAINPAIKIDLCGDGGYNGLFVTWSSIVTAIGASFIDIHSIDVYDESHNSNATTQAHVQEGQTFAQGIGKQWALPEWALNNNASRGGNGDDPGFISASLAVGNASPATGAGSLAYITYFDEDNTNGQFRVAHYPSSQATLKSLVA